MVAMQPVMEMLNQICRLHLENTLDWLPNEWSDGNAKELGMDTQAEKPGYEIFGNIGTSSIRTNTGNGSHVDSKTNGINLGFACRFDSENGSRTYIAPLFDYGGGSYDSYLGNGIHGKGHTHFTTGGIIARRSLNNSVYFESSLRLPCTCKGNLSPLTPIFLFLTRES